MPVALNQNPGNGNNTIPQTATAKIISDEIYTGIENV